MRKFKRLNNKRFGIYLLIIALIITQAGIIINSINTKTNINIVKNNKYEIPKPYEAFKLYMIKDEKLEQEEKQKPQEFIITAYDLSIQSTSKSRGNLGYGITKDRTDLRNQTYKTIRVISADSRIIPLGTKVELKFIDENYKKYDGIYMNRDSGSAIKNNRIDLFIGDFHSKNPSKEAIIFGKTIAKVTILDCK
jgi:3D (Asp-Asp-Asp) domain-containing protein